MSCTKASAPKPPHTARYPPRKAPCTSPRCGCLAEAVLNNRTIGRLDGSIMAMTITCQAARKSGRAIHRGGGFRK